MRYRICEFLFWIHQDKPTMMDDPPRDEREPTDQDEGGAVNESLQADTRLVALLQSGGDLTEAVMENFQALVSAMNCVYKTIVKLLPHDVVEFEPVLLLLHSQDHDDHTTWEIRYDAYPAPKKNSCIFHLRFVLLLWLSILALVPFDLKSIDSTMDGHEAHGESISIFTPRDKYILMMSDCFGHVMAVMETIRALDADAAISSTVHRKLSTKLLQRMGVLYLPPKVMTWRYSRGMRSLEANLTKKTQEEQVDHTAGVTQQFVDADDEMEVPEELEQVIDALLCGLRDRDTVVRWSAAKGVGRVTSRLPFEFADDIVEAVLELFSVNESDGSVPFRCMCKLGSIWKGVANFPHGIDLLTKADYFTLASVSHAYVDVSRHIAKYAEYRYSLMDHVASVKLFHWDVNIRVLASNAIGLLAPLDVSYTITSILPSLLVASISPTSDVIVRHGATLAVSEIALQIASVPAFFDGEIIRRIKLIPIEMDKRRLYRGRGGEMIRAAVCSLIQSICKLGWPLSVTIVKKYLVTIEGALST
ncbi:hypothetical protein DYB32_001137 [Aphanomyces invadans]|uniref:Tubulin-folding cofactor D ARM repeats domain-containing protein n=1 Tax=Aphanomyces invadans TaxID=157072 RepID=A0A3R7AET4_9STRA|nr:hypothetical protein DYB32_001137 [Aphanomyces invadans]